MTQLPLGKAIKVLSNEITRFVSTTVNTDKEQRYTTIQYMFIDYIGRVSPTKTVFQRDLETEFNIRRSTATGILQVLEKNHLIIRQTSNLDARLKEITLTTAGQTLFKNRKRKFIGVNQTITGDISPADIVIFRKVMAQIYENITANNLTIKK